MEWILKLITINIIYQKEKIMLTEHCFLLHKKIGKIWYNELDYIHKILKGGMFKDELYSRRL